MLLFIYFNVYVQSFNPSELNSLKGSNFLESLVKKASNDEDELVSTIVPLPKDLNKESSSNQIETKKPSKIEHISMSKKSSKFLFKRDKCFFFFFNRLCFFS
jgi:hypothetical protein